MTSRSTFKTKPTTTYKRYTVAQLASIVKKLQKQCVATSKTNSTQQCTAMVREIKKVATIMRSKTVQQIKATIKTLKTQQAKRLGVKVSSPKSSSTTVKRLTSKLKQINACPRVSTLTTLCTSIKLSSYKNPVVRATKLKATRKIKSSTMQSRKHKRQTNILTKEIHKLTKRNSFMRRLVNKFRKKVAKLQRSYKAAQAKPRWRVIHGKGTSNVVRINRNNHSSWGNTQRRVG